MEIIYIRKWNQLFDELDNDDKRSRLLENTGPLARAWQRVFPTQPSLTLDDQTTAYALRRQLISNFDEAVSANGICPKCSRPDHATHHLLCVTGSAQRSRTKRHTKANRVLAYYLRSVGWGQVFGSIATEQWVAENRRADILVTVPGAPRKNLDVGITALKPAEGPVNWPTDEEIKTHFEATHPHHDDDDDDDTNNHSNKLPAHPEVALGLTKLALFKKASVDKFIEQMTNQKKHHYGLIPLTPFIMSAGGCLGKEAEEFLQNCYDAIRNSPYQYDLPEFRRGITFRLAAVLLCFSAAAARSHAMSAMRSLEANMPQDE